MTLNFYEEEARCEECNWIVKELNDYKCLNQDCSLRNIEECEAIRKRKHEKLFEETPLTDDQMAQAEGQIKQHKIDRRTGKEDRQWKDKERGK
jgi:hypothetical protein